MEKETSWFTIIGLIAFGMFFMHFLFTGHWFLTKQELETKTFIK